MSVLSIEELRAQLRLCADDNSQDEWLRQLEEQALDYASNFLGRPIPWQDEDGAEVPVPPSVKRALLLLVADFDQFRENTVTGAVVTNRKAAETMLHFYRVGLGV